MTDTIVDRTKCAPGAQTQTPVVRIQAGYTPHRSWRTWLIGQPLRTADSAHETIRKVVGLAVFSSDALSSVAYAPQELMLVLAAAGTAGLGYAFPLSLAIVGLLIMLTLSYEQTIHAYPGGGGAYIVARDNLGDLPAQTAGAALLTDYILTVAVSISSGVAQLVSAAPELAPYRVSIAVGMVVVIMVINLRGLREAGTIFAVPTYFFLAMMVVTLLVAAARYLFGGLGTVADPPALQTLAGVHGLSVLLLLRAFSNGTTALTGVEAISNGIPAFREPKSRNAGITLMWMAIILGTLLVSITFLANQIGAVPSEEETLISQLARTAYDSRGALYLATIASTTVILVMAANTSFAGFPRLGALLAADGFLPRQLTYLGSRLVYSRGIMVLAAFACLLIIAFSASVTALIPLYAIGVFLSFTLSQVGMARRWWKIGHLAPDQTIREQGSTLSFERGWQTKMVINALGAACTAVVTVVFAVTKFLEGAWMVVMLMPLLVFALSRIHSHYKDLAAHLSLENYQSVDNRVTSHRVILAIGGVHKGTLVALGYARTLSDDVTAVHVATEPDAAAKILQKWERWGQGVHLVILDSPYRLFVEPLLSYIEQVLAERQPGELVTVVVPQFVPRRWWHNLLHNQAAPLLQLALLNTPGVIVTDVPFHLNGHRKTNSSNSLTH